MIERKKRKRGKERAGPAAYREPSVREGTLKRADVRPFAVKRESCARAHVRTARVGMEEKKGVARAGHR